MADNHNFRIKNGLEVGGVEVITANGVMVLPNTSTAATQEGGTNNTRIATTAFVQQEITSLIGGAPGSLNTLNELAAAINDDASYASTLTTALATKLPLAGGTLTGGLLLSIPDTGSAPAMTALFRIYGYEGRGAGIKIRDQANSASGATNREWFIGSGYNQSGFNIGYSATGSQSSYADQNKLSIDTSGNITAAGTVTATGGNSGQWNTAYGWGNHASAGYITTDTNTTYSVGNGGLTQINFTSALNSKLSGIATGATNTAAPHYTSAIAVGAGGLTQQNFTTTLKNKLDGIAASANNYVLPFTNNSSNWNTAYGWGNHASAGYTNDQTAAEILTAIKTVDGSGSGLDADTVDGIHSSDIVETSNGNSGNLDTEYTAGMFGWASTTTGRPENYGQGINIVSSGKTHNNVNNWITQLGFGTSTNTAYFRGKTNAGSWGSWYTLWHSGNLTTTNKANYDTAYGWGNHGTQSYATQSYVGTQISNLVDSSPAALNTLNELAAALGDDASFSTTVTNSIATKLPLAGGTLTGNLLLDVDNAEINLKSGVGTTSGAVNWTFNTTGTNYASIKLPYATRASIGLHIDSGYPLTLDGTTSVLFAISGNNKATINNSGLTVVNTITASGGNSTNWNTAYGWGNHASAGYTSNVGDITAVTAGNGLTGGATSGAATVNVGAGDGISVTANTVTVNSTVVRTTGVQTITGLKTFTDNGGIKYSGISSTPLWLNRSSGTNVNIRLSSSSGTTYVGQGASSGILEIGTTPDLIGSGQRVFADNYHPNADVWTTARNHTVTLTGDVTGTATQSVNGSGNKTWTVAATAPVPSAPSITATSVVGETIEVTFSQSSTSGVDHYEVWSDGGSGTDYSLVARVPEEDIASSMSIVDSSFDDGGTIAYRAYAVKNGVYSTAATATRAYTVSTSLDVASLSVVPDINVYHINYNKPASRFIDHIEIYKDAEAVQGNLSRTGAALVYSGANSAFTYSIGASDLDKYHQFWVEVVAV